MQAAKDAEEKAKYDLMQLQNDFSRRGTALSNAANQVKTLENSNQDALVTALEWKAKYMQEKVRANHLERELQERESELRELKREIRGDDTPNPFNK